MVFESGQIEVFDGEVERANLTVTAGLADVVLLTTAPLRMGMPSPVNARGRAVLQKMARGEIRLWGDLSLARAMLELMRIDVPEARFAKPPKPDPADGPRGLDRRTGLGARSPNQLLRESATRSRTPKPVGPLPAYSRSESHAVPAMSRCTHGFSSTNSSRNEPA